ncbi:hypothetical protein AMECASPLE_030319 [Ameca splendens]|uniref:Uncharacterized protein n=1 Tax=Ameca splendens TaxID=208324 RepID=A0ABV1A1F6_9TELE
MFVQFSIVTNDPNFYLLQGSTLQFEDHIDWTKSTASLDLASTSQRFDLINQDQDDLLVQLDCGNFF